MAHYDAIVVGAGAAGCSAGAILAKLGKKVLVVEKDSKPGGRAILMPFGDYKLAWGPHLIEDPGSGLARIFSFAGKTLEIGAQNDGMSVWGEGGWQPVGSLYSGEDRAQLRAIVKELIATDYAEFERYDNLPLRSWLAERTSSEGVFSLFEFISVLEGQTDVWYNHSASDNLYVRKMHFQERGIPGFSFWPKGGFDKIFQDLADAIVEHGGEYRVGTVARVVIEGGRVVGVELERGPKATPNEYPETEVIEADNVIVTVPAWDLLRIVDEAELPSWYADSVKTMASLDNRGNWIQMYVATEEPVYVNTEKELQAWFATPRAGLPGFGFLNSALDPELAPPGKHLFICGVPCGPEIIRDSRRLRQTFRDFEADMDEMFPALARSCIWRRRSVVTNFGLRSQPGLVGTYRPDNRVPGIDGLYLAGDTYRSRGVGIDRAARSALTCVELALGQRIPFFEGTWRY
ncbi:MAG: NAD(P)/FAD-dependent oxidoreductase [Chloroflexota bacterium]|nr:MAG: NAD(P)/FAD-dependent oxidoreductase [Chloroflexota bacterium]